jgi:Tol biopolymer transport system component
MVYAVAFDLKRLAVYGPRVPVIQGVRRSSNNSGVTGGAGAAAFSISSTGVLTYMPGPISATQYQLVLDDRKGGVELLKIPAGNYSTPRVSPDGRRIAFGMEDGKEAVVYIYDLDGGPVRRLTYGGNNRFPIWSGDGKRVAFQSDREGDLGVWWQATAGGAAERLTKAEPGTAHAPESWSPVADTFLYNVTRGSEVSLRTYSLTDKKDLPFGGVRSSSLTDAVFSPNGRWVAYASTEGSRNTTVFVQPFPATGDRFQLVAKGADNPHEVVWAPDGKELLYNAAPNGRFESVAVTTTPVFAFGNPAVITKRFINAAPTARRAYDITPSGRFVGLLQAGEAERGAAAAPQILFVLNWHEELKRLAPTK